jgi:hypothetical protein
MSIRSRVTAAFAACIALPLAAGWATLWLATEEAARHQVSDELKTQSRIVMDTISEQMRQGLTHLKAWSSLPVMQEILINDEAGELAQILVDLNRAYPEFAALTVTDARGLIVATTETNLSKGQVNDAPGIREALSGRTTQTGFTRLRQDAAQAIRFTVPLVATYDRQTVIGTMVASMDLDAIAARALRQSSLAAHQRVFVLARADTRQVIYANRRQDAVAAAAQSISLKPAERTMDFALGGEPGLAAVTRSDTKALGQDPGLIAIAFEPVTRIEVAAEHVSNIYLATTALTALLAMAIAWRWATPLLRLVDDLRKLADGNSHHRTQTLAPYATFASLAEVHETLRARQIAADEGLQRMGEGLKQHMAAVAELVERINGENLAMAPSNRRSENLRDLNRTAIDLLRAIETIIEAAHPQAAAHQSTLPADIGDTAKPGKAAVAARRSA